MHNAPCRRNSLPCACFAGRSKRGCARRKLKERFFGRGFDSRHLHQKITVIWIQITVIFNEVARKRANEGMKTLR